MLLLYCLYRLGWLRRPLHKPIVFLLALIQKVISAFTFQVAIGTMVENIIADMVAIIVTITVITMIADITDIISVTGITMTGDMADIVTITAGMVTVGIVTMVIAITIDSGDT